MAATNDKLRGECAFCGATRTLRLDFTLPRHRTDGGRSTTSPVCPGSNHTPEATVKATTVRDANGDTINVGDRVTPIGYQEGCAIIADITFDWPDSFDRGAAWVLLTIVKDMPAGGCVDTGRTMTRRATRVQRATWSGHTVAGLVEWRDELVAKGSDPGLFRGLTGAMLHRALVEECDNRRRTAEATCLAPLNGAPLTIGTRLRLNCGCLIRATSIVQSDPGSENQHADDPARFVRGAYVSLCDADAAHHPHGIRDANDKAKRQGWKFYLWSATVERVIADINAGVPDTNVPAVFDTTWQRHADIIMERPAPSRLTVARRLVLADVESSRPADRSTMAETREEIASAMARLDMAWNELESAILAGRTGDLDMLRDAVAEDADYSLRTMGR